MTDSEEYTKLVLKLAKLVVDWRLEEAQGKRQVLTYERNSAPVTIERGTYERFTNKTGGYLDLRGRGLFTDSL